MGYSGKSRKTQLGLPTLNRNIWFILFYLFFIYLFIQYFKRVTHLAKSSHSTKWPSTNIINSLKTHIT